MEMTVTVHQSESVDLRVVLLLLLQTAMVDAAIHLKNEKVDLSFDTVTVPGATEKEGAGAHIAFLGASAVGSGGASPLQTAGFAQLWQLQFLTPRGLELCSPAAATSSSVKLVGDEHSLDLTWTAECGLEKDRYQIVQSWTLPPGAVAAAIAMTVKPCGPDDTDKCPPPVKNKLSTGLWAVSASVGGVPQGPVVYPYGFGETIQKGYKDAGGHAYPGSGCTMQFMAAAAGDAGRPGLYFAAHDPAAHMKWLYAHEHNDNDSNNDTLTDARLSRSQQFLRDEARIPGPTAADSSSSRIGHCSNPLAPGGFPFGKGQAIDPGTQSLTITTLIEGAGKPLDVSGYTLPFALAVGVLPPEEAAPMWYSASMIYRDWALQNAEWTAKGPIAQRPSEYAQWFLDLNVWVNSGWQCYDRFNDTQGDPLTVLQNVGAIQRRFNLSSGLGLHWYEWQCGFPDLCTKNGGAHRFKFDTEYPDYFPPRRGSGFRDVVDKLRAMDVFTFPYINGRIFDNNSASFIHENGLAQVVKQNLAPTLGAATTRLSECKEAYGSKELDGQLVYFDVADPTTTYWQDKYAHTINRLVNESNTAGVYVDQLCAGAPLADFTARPTHGVGGGAWWRKGLVALLQQAHDRSTVNGVWAPLVVESNSEFLMDVVNGQLTLVAFRSPFAPPPTPVPGSAVLSPAFPAIYGGYFVSFGSIFTTNDLVLNPDVYASRVAASFVFGAQMGWFSLGGVTHGPDLDTRCGPMYTLDSFLSPRHDAEVEFLQLLAASRAVMQRYFVHGRLVQPVRITPTPQTFMAPPQKLLPNNKGPFPTLSSSVWSTNASLPTICVFLVTSTKATVMASFTMSMKDYFGSTGQQNYIVRSIDSRGIAATVSTVTNGVVKLTRKVLGRSVQMLEIVPSATLSHQ